MKKLIVLSVAILTLSSCASIFTGSKRNVLFESNPSGAKVYVNGFEKGVTPAQIKVKADDRIDFRLDGFKERVVVMDSNFNLVSILNGLSIIGWGVDALTGSLKRVDTKYVKVDMENQSKSVAVENYLDNGEIKKVSINTDKKLIETVIVLNN
ncbi:PEGA domain-containing protein [Seonamhaeicola sp. ML3]|uniref:PEGA domain-containing protein n=1 Tax=Seonamhaeicola sp. ML3 TaxID=2937786 RepID=UPI00200EDD47|nr:PEGA domain-containing protein [Seonamhaeicola sp. ML3]